MLVVCSDGLTGLVRKTEIAAVVAGDSNLARVCEILISLANERGGPDNITVVAARFYGDGLPETSDSEEEPQHNVLRLPGASVSSDDNLTPLPQPPSVTPACHGTSQRARPPRSHPPATAWPCTASASWCWWRRCGSSSADASPSRMKAIFTYLTGGRAGQAVVVEKSYAMLGRAPQADVRFGPDHDLPVSGRHAAVVFRDGDWILRDLASTNGTFVNGERIKGEHQLADQDLIRLGDGGPMLRFGVVRDGLASHGTGRSSCPPSRTAEPVARCAGDPEDAAQHSDAGACRRWAVRGAGHGHTAAGSLGGRAPRA